MNTLLSLAAILSVAAGASPAGALPARSAAPVAFEAAPSLVTISTWQKRTGRRHQAPAPADTAVPGATSPEPGYGESGTVPVAPAGGYVVNRYGFGNYVGGPGGFAGYPAGSAGAQIYRQQEEWKCQAVPETC